MLASVLLATAALAPLPQDTADLRDAYDVLAYRLDIDVDPESRTVQGATAIQFEVGGDQLDTFVLDLWSGTEKTPGLKVEEVFLLRGKLHATRPMKGEALEFTHEDNQVRVPIGMGFPAGSTQTVVVRYSGTPGEKDGFTGFHWEETADGSPWIGTSCQGTGAHWWWPCKANFFNADDKFESIAINATVPRGLYAVSNGRLSGRSLVGEEGERETFHWFHGYGCETYAVTLNIAPYVVVESELKVDGEPFPFIYYVLPENAEKAKVQFSQVPQLVAAFSEAFGPYPFPKSKFGLVETSFWGMEHSTAVAYGSSYPLWCQQNGALDKWASRNRFFDYILVHEVAHEWWGNAVSAKTWGDFWIHEGFGTYAEGVYLEKTKGREAADEYFSSIRVSPNSKESLFRGENKTSGEAYSGVIYSKGALVLNTLRHCVGNDTAWWKTLRQFNTSYRGGNATTKQFQTMLESNTGKKWGQFFEEWFYGSGFPTLKGSVKAEGNTLTYDIDNPGEEGRTFHVPLSIAFELNGQQSSLRVDLVPGENKKQIELPGPVSNVRLTDLHRIAGRHSIEVE